MAKRPPKVRYRIEWREGYARTPYTPWAHINLDPETPWTRSRQFDPPLPPPVPGKGHAMLVVEVEGFAFTFASLAELAHVAEVLGRQKYVTVGALVREHVARHGSHRGSYIDDHWLTRLPRWVRSLRERRRIAQGLEMAREPLEALMEEEGAAVR
jgi:hypothetical protein